jgi:leucyl-tRNA synthetase
MLLGNYEGLGKGLTTLLLLLLQVNGKMRGTVEIGVAADQAAAVEAALGLNTVKKFTDGKEIKKIIYVPGKILNLIVPGK